MMTFRLALLATAIFNSCECFTLFPTQPSSLRSSSRLFASESVATKSPLKSRERKARQRRKAKAAAAAKKAEGIKRNSPITREQMQEHVSQLYIDGPCGVLRKSHGLEQLPPPKALNALTGYPALVLNADYQPLSYLPLSLWSWQDSVKALFTGKVTVVETYSTTVRAVNLELPLPSVIALNEYAPSMYATRPAFTKRNVFLRDEYTCQYCRQNFHTCDLSLDHVVPRCKGGRLTWDNTVTSCRSCNGRKGSKDLSNLPAGMKLWRPPRIPTQHELATISARLLPSKVHPTWEPYLGVAKPKSEKKGEPETMGAVLEHQAEI